MNRSINEVRRLRGDVDSVVTVIDRDPEALFGTAGGAPGRFHAVLTVDAGGRTPLLQVVAVELGVAERWSSGVTYALTWQPVGHHRLLPVFNGSLELAQQPGRTLLRIQGDYRPALAQVGSTRDVVVGMREACRALTTFADDLARRIDAASPAGVAPLVAVTS